MKASTPTLKERTIAVAIVATGLLITLFQDFRGGALAAGRLKRIHELEAREVQLYEQLAQKDAQRESQRRVYVNRIRKGEAQLREHTQEIMTLRSRLEVDSMHRGSSLIARD